MPPDGKGRPLPGSGPPNVPTSAFSVPNGDGKLRAALTAAMAEHGCAMADLTVLDKANDPFRVDTPAGHRDGGWLATLIEELNLGGRTIHLRGLHYAAIGRAKPDGAPYSNTFKDWTWLATEAAKAARFLGYVEFDRIADQRNAAPVIRTWKPPHPFPMISVGLDVELPDLDDLEPQAIAVDFRGTQPYKLVLMWCGRCGKPFDAGPPMCGQVSPGTENAWLPSCCEEPPGHNGEHLGQYGETWDNEGHTNIGECIPPYNDDPALLHLWSPHWTPPAEGTP